VAPPAPAPAAIPAAPPAAPVAPSALAGSALAGSALGGSALGGSALGGSALGGAALGASAIGAPGRAAPGSDARTMALDSAAALAGLAALGAGSAPLAEVVLGRDPGCTIVLDNPVVSARHARFTRNRPSGLLVEDLGSTNGTFVNGKRIARQVVSLADDVRLGSVPVPLSDARIAGMLLRVTQRPPRGQPIVLGSGPSAAVVIDDPDVAPQHAQLVETSDGVWVLKDLGAPAGTFVDNASYRVQEARVPSTGLVLLGRFALPLPVLARLLEDPTGANALAQAVAKALAGLDRPLVHVGRAPENDLVLAHPTVSQRHARLQRQSDGSLLVVDLGSTNGTFVDGERVGSRGVVARPGQRIAIGGVQLVLGEGGHITGAGRAKVRLDLQGVGLVVKDRGSGKPRALLDRVSMSIFPGELVGMLGPSGAGKSTLLMAVLGLLRPSSGGVLLNGRPLIQQYESFRTNVGYVPQDDIVHPQLTVREALWYACKLRLPPMPEADLQQSIERTLKQVGLFEQRDLQIGSAEEKVLSGGQRRRVNLAVELVTDPSLLILDEPTSGLSWTDAADVVATLRRLADDGRTIVLTIHQPDFQEYEKFDSVAILGRGGKLLFFGPPSPDSYEFFGAAPHKPREMFDHVEQMPPDEWRARFEQTQTFQRFVAQRGPGQSNHSEGPVPKPRARSSFRQFPTLLARSIQLTLRNRTALALLLLQAPLLGLLIGLTTSGSTSFRVGTFGCTDTRDRVDYCATDGNELFTCDPGVVSDELLSRMPAPTPPAPGMMPVPPSPPEDLWDLATPSERRLYRESRIRDPRTGLLATLMALFLPMIIASSNVLVSERTIYERERLAGLNIVPYVLARFAVLCGLGAIVVTLNLVVALPLLGLHGNPAWYWIVGVMVTSTASAMGLALSAAVRNPVSALWGINFLVIPQLLFAGSITRLTGFTWLVSWLTTTRYALEALSNVDLYARAHLTDCQIQRYMENLPGFFADLRAPVLYAAAGTQSITLTCILLTMLLLKLKDKRVG
jgi:ABC-type multidrug transport system ATPase subunit/pSer/pThr/pTyr-binding forkhead associated (FHA) protein